MASLFGNIEDFVDESMVFFDELSDISQLKKHGCLTLAQCASLLCLHNNTEKRDRTEDAGTYIMIACNDIAMGKLQVLHPDTLLPWSEYLRMIKAGMYSDDNELQAPMPTLGWLVRLDECEKWYLSKGLGIDLSSVKSDLDKLKAEDILAIKSLSDSELDMNPVIFKDAIDHQEPVDDCFSEDDCLLFDPLTKKQIEQLFTAVPGEDWRKFFDKALRNGLASARHGEKPYKYNPARVANWLYCEGKYRPDALARILSKNLPARSRQHRDSFLECRGLLDEN